jgi:SpoVK/Ycf46/Vps4 family AAA+-type ATPase
VNDSHAHSRAQYVGESEKLTSALFKLARRLKPCIIFIDEIDSLFGARSSHKNSPWRTDLLMQFAQEMDGMVSSDVVVIGTTNRPFDLDDAMIRRLPCRILFELPDEHAREAILRMLLNDEPLAEDVDLRTLARRTEKFSGSDLKRQYMLLTMHIRFLNADCLI